MTAAKEVFGAWEDTWHTQKPGDTRSGPVLCQHACAVLPQLCAQGTPQRHACQALQQAVNECMGQSFCRHARAWRTGLLRTARSAGRSHKSPCVCRAAITPFLAHAAMQGNYKWMLYGDDDTVRISSR